MATTQLAYDHPAYTSRVASSHTTTAGNGTVSGRFAAFTAMIARSAQVTVVTAGTGTGNCTIQISKVTGVTTSSLASVVLGTSGIGVTTNLSLASTALAQGDLLIANNGADTVGVSAVCYELSVTPGASVTV